MRREAGHREMSQTADAPHRSDRKRLACAGLVVLCLMFAASVPSAHDVPSETTLQVFLKPDGNRLHLLARIPLILLLNQNLPKRGPGYLDLEQLDQPLKDSARSLADGLAIFENDARLEQFDVREARVSLPSDVSFGTYDEAMDCLQGPTLPVNTDVFWNQGFFDAHLEYGIRSDRSEFSIRVMMGAGLAGRTVTIMQFLPPGGAPRPYQLVNDVGLVRLDPRWHQAAWVFAQAGFFQILDRLDFLLFVVCLVLPFRRTTDLVRVVVAFAAAHSVALLASSSGLAPSGSWFPPVIDVLIALTILYLAIENAIDVGRQRRWWLALAFGLIYGFGFWLALGPTLQFAGSHPLVSVLSYNVGIEAGLAVTLVIAVPALATAFRHVRSERVAGLVVSVLAAHVAWHWSGERADVLRMVQWPAVDPALAILLVRLSLVAVVAAAVAWFVAMRPWRQSEASEPEEPEAASDLTWGAWDQASATSPEHEDPSPRTPQ
jgi:hypothetical protein